MKFLLCRVWRATITTFPFWSDERGDVCGADQHQIGDGIGEPLDADGRLERVEVLQVETYNRVVSLLRTDAFCKIGLFATTLIWTVSIVVLRF